MAGMGWYGPLIDLSAAASHVAGYVQLLVFVHRCNPVQYKLARGGSVIRTDIHVGDDTRPFFSVSLWNPQLASFVSAGDILLLQNMKVMKFGSTIEARSVQYSSIIRLIHPYTSLLSNGVDDLVSSCRVVGTAKHKLRRVIQWVQDTKSTLCVELKALHHQSPALRNWKVHEDQKSCKCFLLSEVLLLPSPCKATFLASVGEIFLSSAQHDSDKERMFISRRLTAKTDNIVEDMICIGCQLCGSPLSSDSISAGKAGQLYCHKSSNRPHTLGLVYRPFMLYVWDKSEYIPLLVTNDAAKILFGNIRAEKVYQSFKALKNHLNLRALFKGAANTPDYRTAEKEVSESCSSVRAMGSGTCGENNAVKSPNFYLIWLIVLKTLLLQGKNSPLTFEVLVNPSLELEDGRFEMLSVLMPYSNHHSFSET